MSQYSISTTPGLCALALMLASAPLPAQTEAPAQAQPRAGSISLRSGTTFTPPDPITYGNRVESGDLAQVRAWLGAGLDPEYMADRIGTGLMIAAWTGDLKMMELLVARGADVNKANALGEQAVMHAAWRGKADAVTWLLARGARVNRESLNWSALHYAAFAGHGKVADLLLENGADINARSTNGSSPLMMAVYEGHEELVRKLLARGADRSVKNDRNEGALEWAFKYQRHDIARLVAAPQEFVAAANQPKARWGEPVRSLPSAAPPPTAPEPPDAMTIQIESLVRMRNVLAARGLTDATRKMDQRIAALRAQRIRADRNKPPIAVLEISASRAAPDNQRMRLTIDANAPP